jgi:monofunctional glycosyltransferase
VVFLPKKRHGLWGGLLLVAVLAGGICASWLYPIHEITTRRVTVRCAEVGRPGEDCQIGPGTEGWVALPWISRHLQHAVIAAEDARFYEHGGIDWVEVWASLEVNIAQKKYVRGGSTITQQLVRMLFLSREKTLMRKMREAVSAVYLESLLSKDEILEWYVNLVPLGPGVFGVSQASEKYFGTKPVFLTIEQAINLALVLPRPSNWSAGLRNERLTEAGRRRFRHIMNEMLQQHFITKDQWDYTQATGDFGWPLDQAVPMQTLESD